MPALPFVCFHHTAIPSLDQRPYGFTEQHIVNLRRYYLYELGWKTMPHVFVDDHRIWLMGDIEKPGTHAVSFNGDSVGIEVLGNYDIEDPETGRGLLCWIRAITYAKSLGYSIDTVRFHRDDPKTTKTCPGSRVTRAWFTTLWDLV